MSCSTCTRSNQNPNTPNLNFAQQSTLNFNDNKSISANYTKFEQVSQDQFNALITALGQTNSQVAKNSSNLVQAGKDMTKLGQDATWFGKEITALKNKPIGAGFTKSQVEGIIEDYHGDDINRLNLNHSEQEGRITKAYEHRTSIETKADNAKAEHITFHNNFDNIGIALQDSKKHRDSIESKVDNHTHTDGGKSDCAIWDIQCQINKGISGIAILGALGVGGYLLLKKL
jgi:hypothetical protein